MQGGHDFVTELVVRCDVDFVDPVEEFFTHKTFALAVYGKIEDFGNVENVVSIDKPISQPGLIQCKLCPYEYSGKELTSISGNALRSPNWST